MNAEATTGTLALIGGGEWVGDEAIDRALVDLGGDEVLILPTAAAYERPEAAVATATRRYGSLGAKVTGCMVLSRHDAEDHDLAKMVREARFIYLSGGSPLHLRATLKSSRVFRALREAFASGALIAGSSAGAMALSDPMIDPRGGAFTTGLGLVRGLCVVPHATEERTVQFERTLSLATDGTVVVTIGESTGIIHRPSEQWTAVGPGPVKVFVHGKETDLASIGR
jgi:cyanophycinase